MDIRILLEAAAAAYKKFAEVFDYGIPCGEMFKPFLASVENTLGTHEILYDFLCGKDAANIDGVSRGYIPRRGDAVLIDVSIGKDGVWCDVCRTFFVGEIPADMRADYALALSSLRAGASALRDGAAARDIYAAANRPYAEAGRRLVHHAGHAVGASPVMEPRFTEDADGHVRAGQTVTVETGLYGRSGIRLENDFLIEKNGAADLFEDLLPLDIEEYILK